MDNVVRCPSCLETNIWELGAKEPACRGCGTPLGRAVLGDGSSIVLVGPRGVGKKTILQELWTKYSKASDGASSPSKPRSVLRVKWQSKANPNVDSIQLQCLDLPIAKDQGVTLRGASALVLVISADPADTPADLDSLRPQLASVDLLGSSMSPQAILLITKCDGELAGMANDAQSADPRSALRKRAVGLFDGRLTNAISNAEKAFPSVEVVLLGGLGTATVTEPAAKDAALDYFVRVCGGAAAIRSFSGIAALRKHRAELNALMASL